MQKFPQKKPLVVAHSRSILAAVFVTLGLVACSSSPDSRAPGSGGSDSDTGGTSGKGGSKAGGSGGSSTGTKVTGGTGGTTSGGTGGTTSGGTGGTTSGGTGGTVSGGSGGTATGGTAGTTPPGTGGVATGGTTGGGGVTGVPFGPAQPMFSGVAGPYVKPDAIGILAGSPLNYIGLNLFGGGCCFGGADGGDWAYYEEIDFGKHCAFDKLIISYASPMTGGRIRMKLDNPQGPTVGEFTFTTPTGTDFSTLANVTMTVMPVSGKHFVLLQFIGSFGIGNFHGFILEASGARMACPAAQ